MFRHRRIRAGIAIFVLAGGLLVESPLFPYIRSLLVMRVYSARCEKSGIPKECVFTIRIPGGNATKEKDWYPFVMSFSDHAGFSKYIGKPGTKLTILYNFPAFSLKTGASRLFEPESLYYNSFYGAYIVKLPDGGAYGIKEDGTLNADAVEKVAVFDYSKLVLSDFGLSPKEFIFETTQEVQEKDITMAGVDGWTKLSADFTVSGAAHNRNGFVTSYLQYGSPKGSVKEPFAPVSMKSEVFARYFPEYGVTIFFYVMARTDAVAQACEEQILSKSSITDGR